MAAIEVEGLWSEWHIVDLLGEGSFGRVYKVCREDFGHKSYAAVKVVDIAGDNETIRQLGTIGVERQTAGSYIENVAQDVASEIAVMESLKGARNIVSIDDYRLVAHSYDVGWSILIRMELLKSLPSVIAESGVPSIDEIVKLGMDMCDALQCCHDRGILHRDVKPENIFKSDFGDYKLGDFGISKRLESTVCSLYSQKGTMMYIAPEVYRGEHYDGRVDVYSLGIVLYRMLNNMRYPFTPNPPTAVLPSDLSDSLRKRLNGQTLLPPFNADQFLSRIILKACAFDPSQRYPSAKLMKSDLQTWVSERAGKRVLPKVRDEQKQDTIDVQKSNKRGRGAHFATAATYGKDENPEQAEQIEKRAKGRKFSEAMIVIIILIGLVMGIGYALFENGLPRRVGEDPAAKPSEENSSEISNNLEAVMSQNYVQEWEQFAYEIYANEFECPETVIASMFNGDALTIVIRPGRSLSEAETYKIEQYYKKHSVDMMKKKINESEVSINYNNIRIGYELLDEYENAVLTAYYTKNGLVSYYGPEISMTLEIASKDERMGKNIYEHINNVFYENENGLIYDNNILIDIKENTVNIYIPTDVYQLTYESMDIICNDTEFVETLVSSINNIENYTYISDIIFNMILNDENGNYIYQMTYNNKGIIHEGGQYDDTIRDAGKTIVNNLLKR